MEDAKSLTAIVEEDAKQHVLDNLHKYFDHTCLKPDATYKDIDQLCAEAARYNFASVCVAPIWAQHAQSRLRDLQSNVKVCTVIGFPHGNCSVETKIKQIEELQGVVDEFDVVLNIGAIKSSWWSEVDYEIKRISKLGVVVKYIVEVGYLSQEEILNVTLKLSRYGINYIKTCTGYGPRGVTVEDIKYIKSILSLYNIRIGIKASGGIKTKEFALQLIEAGANRIGSSSSVSIINE